MTWDFAFFFSSVLLGIGLAMDAFSVSLANGLNQPCMKKRRMCIMAGVFAGFQALMPFIGYLLGTAFAQYIESFDHWAAFFLLAVIGIGMIREAFDCEGEKADASYAVRTMLVMALATSIDALAVGITFGVLPDVNLPLALSLIGSITFLLSGVGVKIGSIFGARYRFAAQLCGGILLILLGTKILLEHLGILLLA